MSQSSRLPRTIITKNYATDYTSTFENVEVDRQNKRDRVFHNKSRKKYFSSEDQLKYVVESLVLDNGYLMDSERGKKIVFKHPKNSIISNVSAIETRESMEIKDLLIKLLSIQI